MLTVLVSYSSEVRFTDVQVCWSSWHSVSVSLETWSCCQWDQWNPFHASMGCGWWVLPCWCLDRQHWLCSSL